MRIRAVLLVCAAACGGTPAALRSPRLPDPPGYTTGGTGDVHDFDAFAGAWTFTNRRLKQRGVGSTEWDEFPATSCTSTYSSTRPS